MNEFESSRKQLAEALVKGRIDPPTFFAELDAENNELEVRERLAAGRYNSRRAALAEEWLRRREDERQVKTTVRSEALEEESLSVAREANDIARAASFAASAAAASASEANEIARLNSRRALRAEIIAAVAAIAAIVAAIAAVMDVK